MSLSALCQKSADRPTQPLRKALATADVIASLNEPTEYSEGLSDFIHSATSIMVIIDGTTPSELAEHVLKSCGSKLKYVVPSSMRGHEVLINYTDKIIDINREDINQYNYYGVTSVKVPVLLHKSIMDCNAVIVLSGVRYDAFVGYTGGVANVVVALSAKRCIERLAKLGADALTDTTSKLKPIDKALREVVLTASAKVSWFGINYAQDNEGNIVDTSAGDIFISHIKLTDRLNEILDINIGKKYDCVMFETDTKYMEMLVYQIANATKLLKDGCRLLVSAKNVSAFMVPTIMKYLNMSLPEVYEALQTDGGREALFAYHARSIGERFHIAIDTASQMKEPIVKCAWNNIDEKDYAEFVKNCNNTIDLTEVINYAIR